MRLAAAVVAATLLAAGVPAAAADGDGEEEAVEGKAPAVEEAGVEGEEAEPKEGDSARDEEEAQVPAGFLQGERLTGDWGGARGSLAEAGLALSGSLLHDFTRIQKGGIRGRNDADRWWLALEADLDLGEAGIRDGLRLAASYWQMGGEDGSRDLRAAQDISVYESSSRKELARLFLALDLGGDLSLQAGKMDVAYDFVTTDYGNDFVNTGPSFPPNLLAMPVWPDPGAGAAALWRPETGPRAGVGLFDGALHEGVRTGTRSGSTLLGPPDGLYGIAEGGWAGEAAGRPWRAALGAWTHTGDFRNHGVRDKDGTTGWYGIAEGRAWNATEEVKDGPGLALLLRATGTQEGVGFLQRHWAAAAVWQGPLPGRPHDALGLAGTVADLVDPARTGRAHGTERLLEVYYKVQVTGFLSVEPDLQYLGHPGGRHGSALVLGFRAVVDF